MDEKTQDELLDRFAMEITTCTYSEQGCQKLPVRMVAQMPAPIVPTKYQEVEMILLCLDHAKTFKPSGTVIFDRVLPSESVEFMSKHGL